MTFRDPSLEVAYHQSRTNVLRLHLLFTFGLGTAVFALFGLVDWVLGRDYAPMLMALRYGVVLPYGVIVLLLVRSLTRMRLLVHLYQIYLFLAGLLILSAFFLLGVEGQHYYPGLILLFIFAFTVSGLDLRDALVPSLVLAGLATVVCGVNPALSFAGRVNDIVGLWGTLVLGMGGGYMLERLRRLNFWHMHLLQEERNELARLSRTDPLTGLANRRAMDRHLAVELQKAQRYGIPVSLWMVDLDRFKALNDTYGHLEGDRALQLLAKTLQAYVRRAGDLAARYGGDEFAVFLFGCEPPEACHRAHRFFAEFNTTSRNQLPVPVRASVGVVSGVPSWGITPEDLTREADQALYEAKRGETGVICRELFPVA